MEKFCAIIPNRPGREKLFDFCIYQLSKMTLKPDMVYNIDWIAIDDSIDISERIIDGINRAKADGFDLCFILENDDNYSEDYFKRYGNMSEHDFFGSQETIYYNIRNRTWSRLNHPNRSSLFTTGFRISALKNFIFPKTAFVDIALWDHAKSYRKKFIPNTGAIGIKNHGFGLCGGKGHTIQLSKQDAYYNWLRSNINREAFEFYMTIL